MGRNLSGTNLERAGDHNQRVTLHAIRVRGPAPFPVPGPFRLKPYLGSLKA